MFIVLILIMVALIWGFVRFGGKKTPCGCQEGKANGGT